MIFSISMRLEQNPEEKIQYATNKKMEWQQKEDFEASEIHVMGLGYYKWNNAILLSECKKKHEILVLSSQGSLKSKNRSNLTLNQTYACYVCRHMAKLCSYIF